MNGKAVPNPTAEAADPMCGGPGYADSVVMTGSLVVIVGKWIEGRVKR